MLEGVTKGHKDMSGSDRYFHCLHRANGLHECVHIRADEVVQFKYVQLVGSHLDLNKT